MYVVRLYRMGTMIFEENLNCFLALCHLCDDFVMGCKDTDKLEARGEVFSTENWSLLYEIEN